MANDDDDDHDRQSICIFGKSNPPTSSVNDHQICFHFTCRAHRNLFFYCVSSIDRWMVVFLHRTSNSISLFLFLFSNKMWIYLNRYLRVLLFRCYCHFSRLCSRLNSFGFWEKLVMLSPFLRFPSLSNKLLTIFSFLCLLSINVTRIFVCLLFSKSPELKRWTYVYGSD